jgi:hypothetical protein
LCTNKQKNKQEEQIMNKRLPQLLLGVVMVLVLFASPRGWAQPKLEIKKPIITHAFAVERGYYGYIWKIYIEAETPEGEMLKIASVADQPGAGRYPTDWIYLKPQYQKRFRGYLQWNTFSSKTAGLREWTQITLRVSIIDKAGNESNEVVFPFTFESGIGDPYQYDLPPPFNEGDLPRLGHIFIELYQPSKI